MKFFQAKLFFLYLISAILFSACGESEGANQNANGANQTANADSNVNSTKYNTEDFGEIINLPFTPEEVMWRETGSQNTKKLIAVLKFSAQDAQTIAAQAEKHKLAAPAELEAENWFPPELIAKSQESGDESLKGNVYAANDFYSETYKNGKLTRINDTDYFVLEMTSF
jgi:hypothetical protein